MEFSIGSPGSYFLVNLLGQFVVIRGELYGLIVIQLVDEMLIFASTHGVSAFSMVDCALFE
jgi:hypothetical protein